MVRENHRYFSAVRLKSGGGGTAPPLQSESYAYTIGHTGNAPPTSFVSALNGCYILTLCLHLFGYPFIVLFYLRQIVCFLLKKYN